MRYAALVVLAALAGSGWHAFHGSMVSVRYPSTWHATSRALTPVTSPAQVLAVASYPLPADDRGADGCAPKGVDALPAGGAFVYGWGYGDLRGTIGARLRDFPRRPARFVFGRLGDDECLGRSYLFRFRAGGRFFQLYAVLGPRATRKTRATLLRILDSLRVTG